MHILVIEDEKTLADLIQNRLKKESYQIDLSFDGEDGYYKVMSNIYDLVILDIMLPQKSGTEILKEMKQKNIEAKVILLTAKGTLEDKLEGFANGADDYLTKPFHLEELVARVNAKLKPGVLQNNILSCEDIELDLKRKVLINKYTKEEIEVLCKEFLILECLLRNKNQIISKEFLYDSVWGIDNESASNNLEAYISFIRKKLKAISSHTNIKSYRGLGYKLEVTNEKTSK